MTTRGVDRDRDAVAAGERLSLPGASTNPALLRRVVRLIAIVTVVTGGVQCVAPGVILGPLGAEQSGTTRHLFAIIGMFMVIVGGALYSALVAPQPLLSTIRWAGLQKLGAAAAVSLGVARHLFSGVALAVASFDFVSAILIVVLLRRLPSDAAAPLAAS